MNPVTPRTLVRPRAVTVVLAVGALGAVLALTGCINATPTPNTPTVSGSPSQAPTESATPTATSTATATAAASIPVTLKCSVILTAQQVYDDNPNYSANNSYKPVAGSLGATAAADQGRVCGWVNESSGATLEIAVVRPGDLASVTSRAASTGTPVQLTGGAKGYFHTVGTKGQLQVFRGAYWVIISAADIEEASDAQPIAQSVLGNIPAG